ncbi:MAG: histidine phosphatase family protein, partial [Sphingomicrobium sp.]
GRMKSLFVLRHAAATGPLSAPSDFDRPLSARGQAQAADLGRTIRARDLEFGAIIASPARRVVDSVAGLGEVRAASAPAFDPRLYLASSATLLEVIRDTADGVDQLLVVGHNPGIPELLLDLAADDPDGHRHAVEARYPTATLAELELGIEKWRELGLSTGRIVSLLRGAD